MSLRTSSILVHGLTITIRLRAKMLRDDLHKMAMSVSKPALGDAVLPAPVTGGVTLNFDQVDLNFGEVDTSDMTLSEEELNAR